LQIMREKALEITPKRVISHKNIINNSRKRWCNMDVSDTNMTSVTVPQIYGTIIIFWQLCYKHAYYYDRDSINHLLSAWSSMILSK
jgi:hypothetical protein